MRNARFWIWAFGGWVKLTLEPNDTLFFTEGGATDEGYDRTYEEYHFDGIAVFANAYRNARDCDGKLDTEHHAICNLANLASEEADDGTKTPHWQKISSRQRDYSAEAMNY